MSLIGCGKQNSREPIDIPISQIRYSNGRKLRSEGYSICSTLVLDYKDHALMSHVAPFMGGGTYSLDPNYVNASNVVEESVKMIEQKGINPRNCEAIVNSGDIFSLDKINQDLNDLGITIKESKFDSKPRDLEYDPRSNTLTVEYRNLK
ncbi:hypothetical protein CMI42_06105 [Candidatus Pacearchaeota archaeon]|nr:hypothetical protein [Candidatus Pacearchaeota archaeon]